MKTRVINIKTQEPYDVYIGRPSKWGNPFSHLSLRGTIRVDSREEAVELYDKYIRDKPELLDALPELVGKTLGCFCKPRLCHGDLLVKLLKERGLE